MTRLALLAVAAACSTAAADPARHYSGDDLSYVPDSVQGIITVDLKQLRTAKLYKELIAPHLTDLARALALADSPGCADKLFSEATRLTVGFGKDNTFVLHDVSKETLDTCVKRPAVMLDSAVAVIATPMLADGDKTSAHAGPRYAATVKKLHADSIAFVAHPDKPSDVDVSGMYGWLHVGDAVAGTWAGELPSAKAATDYLPKLRNQMESVEDSRWPFTYRTAGSDALVDFTLDPEVIRGLEKVAVGLLEK